MDTHTGLVSSTCSSKQDPNISRRKGVVEEADFPVVLQVELVGCCLVSFCPMLLEQFEQDWTEKRPG